MIFRPELVEALGGAKDLYVAPDGKLNEIPFEAFVAGPTAKTYLVEEGYRFAYLTSGQELLRPKGEPGKGTVIFAGPDFGESAQERAAVAINLRGAFFLSQHVARQCIAAGRPGAIVNIASVHGLLGAAERSVYGTSKGGLIQMTRMLAAEWAEHGIRVNAVAPGRLETASPG